MGVRKEIRKLRKESAAANERAGAYSDTAVNLGYELQGQISPALQANLERDARASYLQTLADPDRQTVGLVVDPKTGEIKYRPRRGAKAVSLDSQAIAPEIRAQAREYQAQIDEEVANRTAQAGQDWMAAHPSQMPTREQLDSSIGASQLQNLQQDQESLAAQRNALSQLQGLSQTGYSDLDRQAFQAAQMQADQAARQNREAQLQQWAARGQRTGGMAQMGALMANQQGANQGFQNATNIALEGRNRALQALQGYGNMAGQMQSQANAFNMQRGSALDAYNLENAQRKANSYQNVYGNLMGVTGLKAGQLNTGTNFQQTQAQNLAAEADRRASALQNQIQGGFNTGASAAGKFVGLGG